jgi:GxxExxY protein
MFQEPSSTDDNIAKIAVDAAFKVHKALGPGLIESVYETCLEVELQKRNLQFERQVNVPVIYDGKTLEAGLRIDLWIERRLIIEVKAVETLLAVHHAQLLTYLKLTNCCLGLLINFNVPLIKNGIKRIVLSAP